MASESGVEKSGIMRWVLALGYWVQGFRCFPWLAVNFFLKDGLKVDPPTLQLLQTSANLPMVGKPIYGVVSDAVYVYGEHRLPYIVLGAVLQAVSWLAVAFLSSSGISMPIMTLFLLLGNLGASIAEVANDAIVTEISKQHSSSKKGQSSYLGELQSFVWMAFALGGVLGNLTGGVAVNMFTPKAMFLASGAIFITQFVVTILVRERSLNLPKNQSTGGIRKQITQVTSALQKPEIAYSIAWFGASYAMTPFQAGTMFFYQTQALGIDSSVLGISKVFGQVGIFCWSLIYNKHLKSSSPRKVISALQATLAVFMVSDMLFVKKFYKQMGVPDTVYVIVFSGLADTLILSKMLPFNVLIAQLCPQGCEGSLMAFVASATALALIVGGYFGVVLASSFGITGSDFSAMPFALMIEAACTLIPVFWSSWVYDHDSPKVEKKEE